MDTGVIITFSALIVFGGLLFAIIALTKKGTRHLDKSYYQSRWLSIENQLSRDNELSYTMSVIDADKLLDCALRQRGFGGKTMGDRLKNAKNVLSNRQRVWSAHKLRNRIAHEANVRVSYDDARHALGGLKQGLKDLGAL